eukprot:340294-Amphidinium_carterae.1
MVTVLAVRVSVPRFPSGVHCCSLAEFRPSFLRRCVEDGANDANILDRKNKNHQGQRPLKQLQNETLPNDVKADGMKSICGALKKGDSRGQAGAEWKCKLQHMRMNRLGFLAQLLVTVRHECVHRSFGDTSVAGTI